VLAAAMPAALAELVAAAASPTKALASDAAASPTS
jgi:hypothetical protein